VGSGKKTIQNQNSSLGINHFVKNHFVKTPKVDQNLTTLPKI
jgi:hypothetical protein